MGRSSRSQANENRARIVRIASGLFRARGIETVSIAHVMEAAGMTQGGFYRHFTSKNELAVEACTLAFAQASEMWTQVARGSGKKPGGSIGAVVRFYLAPKTPEMTCPIVALAFDVSRRSNKDPLRSAYEAGVSMLFDAFVKLGKPDAVRRPTSEIKLLFTSMIGTVLIARFAQANATRTFIPAVLAAADER